MTTRLSWADNAKAIGMILVFWGHLIENQHSLGDAHITGALKYIFSIHMPMFFILAGYFYRENHQRFGQFFVAKVKSRLVPVVFFELLALPFWQHPHTWGIFNVNPADVPQQLWLLARGFPNLNWPCWFLICLFVVELIASEVIPALKKSRLALFLTTIAAYAIGIKLTVDPAWTSSTFGITQSWWFVQEAPVALAFYLLGYGLSRSPDVFETRPHVEWIGFVVVTTLWIWAASENFPGGGHANMSSAIHGDWLWFAMAAASGSLMVFQICKLIPTHRLLVYIGSNTLPLLGLNGLFLHFFNQFIYTWCTNLVDGMPLLAMTLVVSILSLVACLPLVYLLNRFAPLLIGKWR